MDDGTGVGAEPHGEIERLEERIEELAGKIENCRKFMLASRIAVAAGCVLLAAMLFGAIDFDAAIMLAGIAAVLGGFVLLGSNRTTADEAATEMAEAENARAALIGQINLRVVSERATLH